MAMHKIKITQTIRMERSIVIEVEADSLEEAIESQQASEAPADVNPGWSTIAYNLVNEDVEGVDNG